MRRLCLLGWDELHRNRIDAVPDVFLREPFSRKYVPKMSAAGRAEDLRAHPVRIRLAPDRPFDLIVEARPAAVGIELVARTVERRVAPPADVSAGGLVVGVLPGERTFSPLVNDNVFFFGRERIELHGTVVRS